MLKTMRYPRDKLRSDDNKSKEGKIIQEQKL